jgi:hypothetical protein
MKITLREINEIRPSLESLLKISIPAKISFKLGRLCNQIRNEFKECENQRENLIKKYGQEDKEKGEIRVLPENIEKFTNELRSLLEVEVDLNFDPVSIGDFGEINLPVELMANLHMFIKE